MRRRQSRSRQSAPGYTLIEILVVVVIVGVMVVAAIPTINKYLPRYRLERVAENLGQACRVARHGAVTKHCNHVLRFWRDEARTVLAGPADPVRAFDILLDRNNNMTFDPPSGGGTDTIIKYGTLYGDVDIYLDPDFGPASQEPYPSYNDTVNPVVFRADGQIYEHQAGDFIALGRAAIMVESKVLPDANPATAEKSLYKYRWVELDRLGSVRVEGLRRF